MDEVEMEDCQTIGTKFFTTADQTVPIFADLLNFLYQQKITIVKEPQDKWKLKYSFADTRYQGPEVKVTVLLEKIADHEGLKVVEFIKTDGLQQAFSEHFKEVMKALEVYRDATFSFE